MFTGKGDTSRLSPSEVETWDDIRRLMETGHVVGLSPEQTELAIEAIRVYSSVKAATGLISSIRNVSFILAASLLAGWSYWDTFVGWLRRVVTGT